MRYESKSLSAGLDLRDGDATGGSADGKPSWQSRAFNRLLRLLPFKKRWTSAAAVQVRVRELELQPVSYAPVGLGRDVEVVLQNEVGWPVYHTMPATNPGINNYAVFLHGGGYIEEIGSAHWRFVDYLTRQAPARCVVPIFPLAPRATAKDLVPLMGDLLRRLIDRVGAGNVAVLGNSAGAGLALATAQWLRDSGLPQPKSLILISPWLDASVSRKEQAEIAALDPMQDIPGLIEAARLYAGELDIGHPFVSPLNGGFRGLAPMTVFTGTLDLLHPDSIDLKSKAEQAGTPVELYMRKGLPHNYAMLPTPEGREARAIIARVVAGGKAS